ncbi:hypothetical protein AYO38_03545 [bacterium SCGC AG-212-C10]|nr:hypothetical protein AYO38_03545 [bacterium SCGC AG-212-C10]
MLPFPFLGSPSASIVLLNLNPGIAPDDGQRQGADEFLVAHAKNLQHIDQPYPFFLLDPAHRSHPGYSYWTKHLKQLIDHVGAEALSRELLVLEWIPYASRRKPSRALRLASQGYTLELARAAIRRGAVVIGLRSLDAWLQGLPELAEYPRFYRLKARSQRNWVTKGNLEVASAFDDVLANLSGGREAQSLIDAKSLARPGNVQAPRTTQARTDPGPVGVDVVFVELQARIRTLGDDVSEARPRGGERSLAFNRAGCLNFVCITKQGRSVKVETLDQSLNFGVTIHVGSRDLSVDEAAPVLRQGYDLGALRRR